ncbi:IS701 family transposase (plasmid) [Streptomyces sp. NBC_01136]|uniref:IS701 family transposase n=1 Tax=unclassified Streptomyces TaxID=2593676 RepID=UPI00324DB14C|nr:IS701 family transposase [Streptomyces sp. NBC_01136]
MEGFAAEIFEPFARDDQRRWGQVYLRGLLTDGRRKSVEPMAARLGQDGNRQAMAHFVTTSPWDPAHVRARLAWMTEAAIRPTAVVFDDTGFLKDGDASACVSRQYTGTAGKVTNCQVGVSLHLASDHASAAVDWRLFLPKTWDPGSAQADPGKVARRAACGIPDGTGHVEKWQLALDMLDETRSWGIEVPLAIADAGYGDAAAFRLGLQDRAEPFEGGLPFVVSGVGPWDPEPDGGFQPDVLAARLLAFVSDWRGPEGPLTDDQREWFSWLGPEVNAMLPREETAAVEWMNGRRVSDS